MSSQQFWRLTLVILLPLLVAGWFYVNKRLPSAGYFLCDPYSHCVNWGESFPEHEMEHAWFWLNPGGNDGDSYYVFGHSQQLRISSAKIVNVRSVYTDPEATELIGTLVGRNAAINFQNINTIDFENNRIVGELVQQENLFCTGLTFLEDDDLWEANCRANSWSGDLIFEVVDTREREVLEILRSSFLSKTQEAKQELRFAKIFGTPIFVYLYFGIALCVWIIIRLFRFVKSG